jgi:hypothetical protein
MSMVQCPVAMGAAVTIPGCPTLNLFLELRVAPFSGERSFVWALSACFWDSGLFFLPLCEFRERASLVALERFDHQREPGRVSQQPRGSRRRSPVNPVSETGLPEPVTLTGLEIQRPHVVEHQGRRAERGTRDAATH